MKRQLIFALALVIAACCFSETIGLTQISKPRSKSTVNQSQKKKPAKKIQAQNQRKGIPSPQAAQQEPNNEKEDTRVERAFLQQRLYPLNEIPEGAYERAQEQWQQLSGAASEDFAQTEQSRKRLAAAAITGTNWVPIGPVPVMQGSSAVNGRVNAIAINPNNPNVIYVGAAFGGVWKSTNAGANWTPLFDQQPSLGVGESNALAIDPNNTDVIYVGTSSRFFGTPTPSKGMLKSTDGGASWAVLGADYPPGVSGNADLIFGSASINRIIVDPANSNIVYAGANNGLYRSTNGGRDWTLGTGGFGDAETLSLDTSSPIGARVLFAGVRSSGVRRSTDGGQTWTQVLNATTPAVAGALSMNGWGFGKVAIALAPPTATPNPNGVQVIYATMQGAGVARDSMGNPILDGMGNPIPAPDPIGVFQSVDQGATWTQRPGVFAAGRRDTQGGFNLTLGVDPASPGNGTNDIVYYGAVGMFRSTDSGANFANTQNGMHVDTHADWTFVPRPGMPSQVYTGNDGGIWRSDDDGAHWTGTGMPGAPATINAGGFQTALIYNLAVKNDATASVSLAGLQDNGMIRTTGSLAWDDTKGGDGWDVKFDAVMTDRAYHTGGFYCCGFPCTLAFRSGDSGANWPDIIRSGIPDAELGCGLSYVAVDPNQAGVLYVSGLATSLFQSQDAGGSYRNIGNLGGTVVDTDVAKGNSNFVAAAAFSPSANAWQVWVSTNALATTVGPPSGVTFANITRNLPNRFITRVAFDPNDPNVIYATLSGFGLGHIFRTTITGTAWTDISPVVSGGGIFDVPFNAIALDGDTTPTTIYVGTDLGVIRSVNGGASWTALDDQHLPNVPVTDLVINPQAKVLRAATFGRGVFELKTATGPVIAVNVENGGQFTACRGESVTGNIQVFNVGTTDLRVDSVQRLFGSGDFTVLALPSPPLNIGASSSVNFTVRFAPTAVGTQSATIRISSDDPASPFFDLIVTGTGEGARIVANDPITFDKTCPGQTNNKTLTIGNSGMCDLVVSSITSSSPEFKVVGVVPFPLVIPPGSTRDVTIQFMPMGFTVDPMQMATLTINSNDLNTPNKMVKVIGIVPPPVIQTSTDSLDFGKVCLSKSKELPVTIRNTGECNLTVSSIAFSSTEFKLASPPTFPFVIPPGGSRTVMVSFMPVGATGARMETMTINSDDPATPAKVVTLKGEAPVSDIAISGPTNWGDVAVGKFKDQVLYITNTEACDLAVTLVCEVRGGTPMQASVEFNLVSPINYPIIIPGGATMPIRIRFKPERTGQRTANLFVCGFDPQTPGGTTPAFCPPGNTNLKKTVILTGRGK